jgi:hypothetical protein
MGHIADQGLSAGHAVHAVVAHMPPLRGWGGGPCLTDIDLNYVG